MLKLLEYDVNCISFKVSKNFAVDIAGLYLVRRFSDGITFIKPVIDLDLYEGDHKPALEISLIVLNFIVFSFEWYNINHVGDKPFRCPNCDTEIHFN